jgi:hypothetical protein
MGSAVISHFVCPLVGCRFRSLRHVSAHVLLPGSYIRGEWASWDSSPTEAEIEEIKPLLARIQELKSGRGGALSGTQLMAFFLQHRVQPLQHRLSKLWTFSGLEDPSRVSKNLMEKKDLDRRARALTTLTKDHEVADLAASHFDSEYPLPAVIFAIFTLPFLFLLFFALYI